MFGGLEVFRGPHGSRGSRRERSIGLPKLLLVVRSPHSTAAGGASVTGCLQLQLPVRVGGVAVGRAS